jgi:hypothetical protein
MLSPHPLAYWARVTVTASKSPINPTFAP